MSNIDNDTETMFKGVVSGVCLASAFWIIVAACVIWVLR